MGGAAEDDSLDRRVDEIVRIASELADDDLMDLPPDEILKSVMERGRGPQDDGGAAITVPAPQRPSRDDSASALPLPIEDEAD